MPSVATASSTLQHSVVIPGTASPATKVVEHTCCNPFRIQRHFPRSNLRVIPEIIRERLPRVSFTGPKICDSCRNRVYQMLKERKYLKPSPRLSDAGKKKSDSQRRTSDIALSASTIMTTSPRIITPQQQQQQQQEKTSSSAPVMLRAEVQVPEPPGANTLMLPVETVPSTVSSEVSENSKDKMEVVSQTGTSDATSNSSSHNLTGKCFRALFACACSLYICIWRISRVYRQSPCTLKKFLFYLNLKFFLLSSSLEN